MLKVTHDELKSLVVEYYNKKLPLLVFGRFGIGKSDTFAQCAKDIAAKKGKQYANWNALSREEKKQVIANPKDYFVLIDIRLSEYDSSDIKGLPVFKDNNSAIEFKTPVWAMFMNMPESDGILFFDEINLAPPLVMSSCYKIIYDRIINESPIAKDWIVVGAGNLDEDRAYTNHVAPPLKDRAGEVELVGATADGWTKWAMKHGIEPRIIGFINFKEGHLYKVDFNDNQKFTTYRGWERVSKLINGVESLDKMGLLVCSAIGEGIGKEFIAFCKISKDIDLPGIIANPARINTLNEMSIKWFITTAVAEKYSKNEVKFDKLMDFSQALDSGDQVELVAYLWKMCASMSKHFKKDFSTSSDTKFTKLFDKYKRYLLD